MTLHAVQLLLRLLVLPQWSNGSVDRTSELRDKGFEGRRLGPVQMTTDTAVRVTRMVIQNKSELLRPFAMPSSDGA